MTKPDKVLYELWDCHPIKQDFEHKHRTGIIFTADRVNEAVTYYLSKTVLGFSFVEDIRVSGELVGDSRSPALDVDWVLHGDVEDFSEFSYKKVELFL